MTIVIVITLSLISFSLASYQSVETDVAQANQGHEILTSKSALLDHPAYSLFKENCMRCHKVNSELIGPALAGVSNRRTKEWIFSMVKNSSKLIASGDMVANQLYKEYRNTAMPNFDFLTDAEISGILDYVNKASK